jgi:hypothetical protein
MRRLAVVLLAVLSLAALPATAEAGLTRPSIEVSGTTDGFTAPSSRAAGLAVFRVGTTDPEGIRLGLVRLRPGVRVGDFLTHLHTALTSHGPDAVEAGAQLARDATLYGGALAVPGRSATFTQVLAGGTYHLVDYADVEAGRLSAHALAVGRNVRNDHPALPTAVITMTETADGPRFVAPDQLRAGATILVRNATGQFDEAVFVPVGPDTTEADVQAFFEHLDCCGWPADNPFAGFPQGAPVLSPGGSQLIQPGQHTLVTIV